MQIINSIFKSANNGECDENTEKRILSSLRRYKISWRTRGNKIRRYFLNLSTVMGFSGRFLAGDLLVNSFVLKSLTDG